MCPAIWLIELDKLDTRLAAKKEMISGNNEAIAATTTMTSTTTTALTTTSAFEASTRDIEAGNNGSMINKVNLDVLKNVGVKRKAPVPYH